MQSVTAYSDPSQTDLQQIVLPVEGNAGAILTGRFLGNGTVDWGVFSEPFKITAPYDFITGRSTVGLTARDPRQSFRATEVKLGSAGGGLALALSVEPRCWVFESIRQLRDLGVPIHNSVCGNWEDRGEGLLNSIPVLGALFDFTELLRWAVSPRTVWEPASEKLFRLLPEVKILPDDEVASFKRIESGGGGQKSECILEVTLVGCWATRAAGVPGWSLYSRELPARAGVRLVPCRYLVAGFQYSDGRSTLWPLNPLIDAWRKFGFELPAEP